MLSFFATSLLAQTNTVPAQNIRVQKLKVLADTISLDSLSIVPGTIICAYDSTDYFVDYAASKFTWHKKPIADSFKITYRVFPFSFTKAITHKNKERNYETNVAITPYYQYTGADAQKQGAFVDFGNMDYAGTFGRALSFGNNQDVVLNSQFNLNLEGNIGDSIKIRGAITDNTIPFQPEGNTQQIQEFDRVSIQLERKNTKLTAGDFELRKPNSYFMNFYKRVQGGLFETKTKTKKGLNTIQAGASFAKGKWVRNQLTPLEGNQGPYKLTGPNGETFFIVLAGTERVYIDGIQLERGEDKDYIIDYNTSEVTFMPRRLITKDLRIFVEFEFADRNYLNSLLYLSDDYQVNDKLNIRVSAYANQDAKNQPVQSDLDSLQKNFLGTIGNNIKEAQYPAVRFDDTFSVEKILYKRVDTVVNSTMFNNIYVFSTNPDSAKYSLSFSQVGAGNGNYIQSINAANGRVYSWIAPVNGQPQGDYEPVILLVTPKKQQMLMAAANYQIDSNKSLMVESAVSNYDPNTFSSIDNNENLGVAQKIIYTEKRNLFKDWQSEAQVNYEFVQQQFDPIERFRNVEFIRDWNITEQELPENEHLGKASVRISKSQDFGVGYTFGTFQRGGSYKGYQHIPEVFFNKKGYRIKASGNNISQTSLVAKTNFFRPIVTAEKTFEKLDNLVLGAKYLQEKNTYRNPTNDTLLPTAFSFNEYRLYARNSSEAKKQFTASYMYRDDYLKKAEELSLANFSHNFSLNGQILSLKNQSIRLTSTFRQMQVVDSNISPQRADESLLGRLEYNYGFFKGMLSGNMLYEFGSGQEQKREFAYVEVPAGQGVYVWRDYNNDGLRQLNEFEIANFPDEKRFIKIFTPTNQYVKAKYSQFNHSVTFNPRNYWNGTKIKGLKKGLSYFFFQSSIQLQNRFLGQRGIAQYNPFLFQFDDSLLINNASSIINSVFFNRFSNKWGLDYVQTTTTGKTLLNYGIDRRRNIEHLLRGRANINRHIAYNQNIKLGKRSFFSQFLDGRSYDINYNSVEPSLTFLLKKNQLRITTSYKYDQRQNSLEFGNEKAISNAGNLDIKYNMPSSGSINIRGTYNGINFNGDPNSGVGYTMLDGLQNGQNYLWAAGLDKKLSKSIEMSLQYEGRKPGDADVIHTGRATVRAIF